MRPIDKFLNAGSGSKLLLGMSRKTRILSVSALFLAACAMGAAGVAPMAPDASNLPVTTLSREIAIPTLSDQIQHLQSSEQHYFHEERMRSGDTLATLLHRLGVDDAAAADFIKSDRIAYQIFQLKPGRLVLAETTEDGDLAQLTATVTDNSGAPVKNVVVRRDGDRFVATEASVKLERRVEMHSGEIRSSLFAATDAAQVPDSIASQIVDMFSTNIDFASDLRRGDRFNIVYETFWQNGEFVRAGRVLAGEFVNNGTTYQSVWFDEPDNKYGGGFYTLDGKSLKKAFLKSPLEFSRISSGFSGRMHPILGQWRQHQGVDFAAPQGTPVRASGDGVVDFVGTQNGYGNIIVLKHWDNYSTAYAHLSRFMPSIKSGTKVSQGEVIGYVGTTGWATGPHLHYEFRVNNQPRDPLSIDVPNNQPLAGAELARFKATAGEMRHRLALLNAMNDKVQVAAK